MMKHNTGEKKDEHEPVRGGTEQILLVDDEAFLQLVRLDHVVDVAPSTDLVTVAVDLDFFVGQCADNERSQRALADLARPDPAASGLRLETGAGNRDALRMRAVYNRPLGANSAVKLAARDVQELDRAFPIGERRF